MKRWFCAVLAASLLLCGCSDLPEASDPATDGSSSIEVSEDNTLEQVALAYSHDDTLNPYAATTAVNAQLTGLLYDSLTVLDTALTPQLSLAAEIASPDPTHLVVSLRTGAVFADGSAVTAADVVSSFTEAKRSARYGALLSNVASAKADKQGTVTFTLSAADPHSWGCLTFPILKQSTLTTEKGQAPLGGGVYVLQSVDGGAQLVANPHYTPAPHYAAVSLRHLPNHSARHYALASGEIAYYYNDLIDGNLPGIVGANRAVPTNALVYVGANSARPALASAEVRQALSKLLDREAVCRTAYASWAVPSAQPFHPQWGGMVSDTTAPHDIDGAVALLDGAGYVPRGGKRLTLELIYSTDRADRARVAELVRSQMESGGVAVTLVPLPEAEYRQRLAAGLYDLYVAEIRLTADMSLRPLLMGGASSYGITYGGAAATAYGQYLSGGVSLEDFLTAFAADMPYIPVCWRHGLAAYDRRLTTVTPTGYDPYSGFAAWQ